MARTVFAKIERSAVRQVVAVHGRYDQILPAEIAHRIGDANRFQPVDDSLRVAGLHVAEAAAARARVAEDHDRRRARSPALGKIRTVGFFANRVERKAVDFRLYAFVLLAVGQFHFQPFRFRNAFGPSVDEVDLDCHYAACDKKEISNILDSAASTIGFASSIETGRFASRERLVMPRSVSPQGLMSVS